MPGLTFLLEEKQAPKELEKLEKTEPEKPEPEKPKPVRSGDAMEQRVINTISKTLRIAEDTIGTDTMFVDLGDSLALVELMMAFEREFSINMPDDITSKITTVGDAVTYMKKAFGKIKKKL